MDRKTPHHSSLPGDGSHRRARAVHKLRLEDASDLSEAQIVAMVGGGDVELIVRRSQLESFGEEWSQTVAEFFDKVAQALCSGAPSTENRTVIVNLLCRDGAQPPAA